MNTKPNEKKAISWLTLAHFSNDLYAGFLNPIMPFIAAKIGFSMAIATVIISISQIFSSVLQPVFGFFADNMLKRFFIFWGLLFGSLFVPISVSAPNVFVLTILIILGNIGGSFFHPQATGFILKFSKQNAVSNMGIFISAGTLGYSFGPMISSLVTEHFGLESVAYTAIAGVILAFSMFGCVPKISHIEQKPVQKEFKKTFKEILTNKFMVILIVIAMMKSLIANSSTILLPFLWKDMGYSPTYIGTALFFFLFAGGLGSYFSGRLERKIGGKKVFYLSMIGTLPIMLLFILTYKTLPVLSLIFFILTGFLTMLATPVTMVMAQKILPDYKSIIAGFIQGFSWGVVAVFLSAIGFAAQTFGIINVLIVVSFVPAITSYLVKYLPDETVK